jgi:hypothetical protein
VRRVRIIPKTDLGRLEKEVLERGHAAALPRHLPDRWLRIIARDVLRARVQASKNPDDPNIEVRAALLLVLSLISVKTGSMAAAASLPAADLQHALRKYEEAIEIEILGRETGVFLQQYTMETVI